GLRDEGEAAVLVDGDLDRDHVAAHGLGLGVVGLAEVHDVHAVRTERGTDRRCRRRGTRLQLDLDQRGDLLLGRHGAWASFVSYVVVIASRTGSATWLLLGLAGCCFGLGCATAHSGRSSPRSLIGLHGWLGGRQATVSEPPALAARGTV